MMSLVNLVMTLDPKVRTLFCFFCVLTSLLVVLVFWGLAFFHQKELSPKVIFLRLAFSYKQELSPKVVDPSKCFGN